jgi:hypothetical protein
MCHLVTGKVPSSPILVSLMMEALLSFKTSVLTRATRHNNPEGGILLFGSSTNLIHNPTFIQLSLAQSKTKLSGSFTKTERRVPQLRWERRPPAMEDSCEYIE